MIKLEKYLNFYNSYFNGIQQICEHKSAKEVAEGALKVASYITILMPLIVQVMCLVTQAKINYLAGLKERAVNHLNNQGNTSLSQKDCTDFLEASVADQEYNHFEPIFQHLTPGRFN